MITLFKKQNKYLVLILFVAFVLRAWGIWFGLPHFHFHADENFIISNLLKMIETKSFAPQNVVYPTFIYYILGIFSFFLQLTDRHHLLLLGRSISLIFGTFSVLLLYLVAKEFFSQKIALFSAFFLAINFLHSVNSQYLKVDVAGTFFGLLSFFLAAKVLKEAKLIYYILGGIFLGLAFATQYLQLFFLIPFLLAHIFSLRKMGDFGKFYQQSRRSPVSSVDECFPTRSQGFKRSASSFAVKLTKKTPRTLPIELHFYLNKNFLAFLLFFLIFSFFTNPYLFMDFNNFLSSKSFFEQAAGKATQMLSENNLSTPIWYFLYFLMSGVYYPVFLLTIIGALLLISRKDKIGVFFLSYPFVFLIFLFLNRYRVDRMAVSLMPFFAICSGLAIVSLEKILQKIKIQFLVKKLILVAGISLILIIPLARSLLFSLIVAQKDTRQLVAEWVEENYPKEQAIFAIGDTMHIGHYLQKNGFDNVINAYPLESQDIFLYSGEVLLIDSTNYHIAKNYLKVESYKKFWENYQLIKAKGKLIQEFSQPLFKAEFFSPAFLEHSSTVNAYHNPTVEIYKIPELPGFPEKEIKFEYFPEAMKKIGTNMELVEEKDRQRLYAGGDQEASTAGPYEIFPKGDYLLQYFLEDLRCNSPGVVFTLQVTSAGGGREFASRKVSCWQLEKYNRLTLNFQLENASLLELKMTVSKGASFFVEKALLTREAF